MEENRLITLEDGNSYIVLDEIAANNIKFIYLANNNEQSKFVIRKEIIKEGRLFLQGLKDENEFNEALVLFKNKNV